MIIALIIWVFLPSSDGDWRPYTFDKELAEIEAKRAIPDSEIAAIIYNQLLEIDDEEEDEYEPNFVDDNCYDLTRSEPWLSKDHPEITEWLQRKDRTIAMLMNASRLEKCRFPINADLVSISYTMDRLAPMRRWAYLLIRAANNDMGEGRINQAIEKNLTVLKMAKHQYQQPIIIDMLVGIAIEALAIKQFNTFVVTSDATEERLSIIEKALAEIKHDWSSDLPKILECEKLLFKSTLGMFYETNPKGQVRLSHNPIVAAMQQCREMGIEQTDEVKICRSYWQKKLIKASTILWWFYMPSTPQKASEIIDAGHERLYAMAEPDFDWQKGTEKPTKMFRLNYRYLVEHLAEILAPAYHRVHDLYLRLTSDQRGSLLMIALRRHKNKTGHWPESLDDVKDLVPAEVFVDPINNDSFVYKLTEENFTLYSKGKNNIDDDGKRDKWDEKTGADDWLIWPKRTSTCDPNENTSDVE